MSATGWQPMDLDRQAWGIRSVEKKAARKRAKIRRRERDRQLQIGPDSSKNLEFERLLTDYLEDQPGNALGGAGMPLGATLRMDGESHSTAWKRILRADPCAYCNVPISTTVDHVFPRSQRKLGTERWVNLVGACGACNCAKSDRPLLEWLLVNRDRLAQAALIE